MTEEFQTRFLEFIHRLPTVKLRSPLESPWRATSNTYYLIPRCLFYAKISMSNCALFNPTLTSHLPEHYLTHALQGYSVIRAPLGDKFCPCLKFRTVGRSKTWKMAFENSQRGRTLENKIFAWVCHRSGDCQGQVKGQNHNFCPCKLRSPADRHWLAFFTQGASTGFKDKMQDLRCHE